MTLRMNTKTRIRIFALLAFLFIPLLHASGQEGCLSYEPSTVKLTGKISRKTFPGPPNYESIRRGDEAETYWILHLASPVCTTASTDNDAESGVRDIQLILAPKQYVLYRKFVIGRARVEVTGKLLHAITGHHHTQVLLEVKGMSRGQLKSFQKIGLATEAQRHGEESRIENWSLKSITCNFFPLLSLSLCLCASVAKF
jgi:hypothetical protein